MSPIGRLFILISAFNEIFFSYIYANYFLYISDNILFVTFVSKDSQ